MKNITILFSILWMISLKSCFADKKCHETTYINKINSSISKCTSIDILQYVKKIDETGKGIEYYEKILDSLQIWENYILIRDIGFIADEISKEKSPIELNQISLKIVKIIKKDIPVTNQFGKMMNTYLNERIYFLKSENCTIYNHMPSKFDKILFINYHEKVISEYELKFFIILSHLLTDLNSKEIRLNHQKASNQD
jgi:hypothetical protein